MKNQTLSSKNSYAVTLFSNGDHSDHLRNSSYTPPFRGVTEITVIAREKIFFRRCAS